MAGCSSNIETEIVGEWRGRTVKQDLVFYEDGRIEMKGHKHGMYEGRYTIGDGNKLTCDFERLSNPIKCTVQVRGKTLTLVHSGGREGVYDKN